VVRSILKVSQDSLRGWADNLVEFGDVLPSESPLQGRPRALSATQIYALTEFIEASLTRFLDELQDWSTLEHDALVPKTTLHNKIQQAELTFKIVRRRAAEWDEIAREPWRQDVATNLVAKQMVWTDESSKDDRKIYRD
jgi:transposase